MPTAVEIERTLAAELPNGTSATDVVAYLTRRDVEHSGYVAAERIVNAVYRDPDGAKLIRRAVRVDFTFTADARLRSIAVTDAFTGL